MAKNIRFEQLCEIEPRLRELWLKSQAIRDNRDSDSFCANWHWYKREGLKSELCQLVGWEAEREEMQSSGDYDVAYHEIYDQLPNCRNCLCL